MNGQPSHRVSTATREAPPYPVQVPGGRHGAHDVVPALDDDAGDVADAVHVPQQLVIGVEEPTVHEVVALGEEET